MSADVVIRIEDVWKQYHLGTISRATLQEDLQSWWARFWGKDDPNSCVINTSCTTGENLFWALQSVTLDIKQGEVLGIIGRNGAGKSTLLKILSRVTSPTKGLIKIKGRVASLLEVGTGFHPELTGRENVFLNGAILGMSKAEMLCKFDKIVAFAEIDKFIDTPVKRYSSGMYVRLAFAVAAHLEPEILIIDEVLAVGDALFQKKCLGKMQEVSKEGRTVLFVSHNIGAIHTLTQKCVYLEKGMIHSYGDTHSTVSKYLNHSLSTTNDTSFNLDFYRPDYVIKAYKNERKVQYTNIWAEQHGEICSVLDMGVPFVICFELKVGVEISGANISFAIYNSEFQCVTVIFSWDNGFYLNLMPGSHVIRLVIEDYTLPPGKYYVGTGLNQSTETVAWDGISNLPLFEVRNSGKVVHWLHRQWGGEHWDKVHWHQEY